MCTQEKLGRKEAEKAVHAALAAATGAVQSKRVEILVPPQAAAWLQVCPFCHLRCSLTMKSQRSNARLILQHAVCTALMHAASTSMALSLED